VPKATPIPDKTEPPATARVSTPEICLVPVTRWWGLWTQVLIKQNTASLGACLKGGTQKGERGRIGNQQSAYLGNGVLSWGSS